MEMNIMEYLDISCIDPTDCQGLGVRNCSSCQDNCSWTLEQWSSNFMVLTVMFHSLKHLQSASKGESSFKISPPKTWPFLRILELGNKQTDRLTN